MILQGSGQAQELREVGFVTEKEMQRFCENNLSLLLGLQFVASEMQVAQFRLDSVAYNASTRAFVIIEYKNDRNFSVIDQGYSYIATLLNYKANFVLTYNQVFKANKRIEDFDWTQVRVLFIAPSYTSYQIGSVNFRDLPMELWRIKRYEQGITQLEQIKPTNTVASISGYVSGEAKLESVGKEKKAAQEVIVYSEEERLADGSDITREYYTELRDYILSLDDSIELKATKLYVGFMFHNRNLTVIRLQKNSILVWLNTQYGVLDDPQHLIEDVTHKGHHGSGDCQIKISDRTHMGYIKDLLYAHYQKMSAK